MNVQFNKGQPCTEIHKTKQQSKGYIISIGQLQKNSDILIYLMHRAKTLGSEYLVIPYVFNIKHFIHKTGQPSSKHKCKYHITFYSLRNIGMPFFSLEAHCKGWPGLGKVE